MRGKELDFVTVGGSYYGGDQNWNRRWLMRLGGCSTTTACESCICLAKDHASMRALYPFSLDEISIDDFRDFSEIMFQFVHPGIGGLTDIHRYASMVKSYAQSRGIDVRTRTLSGELPERDAREFIVDAIDDGCPVAYLMLRHRDPRFDELEWHWFSITGYEAADSFQMIAATYGHRFRLDLSRAWATGYSYKGGLAVMKPADAPSASILEGNF